MRISELADGLLEQVEHAAERAGSWLEPTLRLGVTGLSGAGKTVFITSLAASLLHRGRLAGFAPEAEGRILAAQLSPQPDPELPRFAFEGHLAALTGDPPAWPESTRAVSQLRISLRHRPSGFLGAMGSEAVLHLDIVDYPGEWLVDLALLPQDYATWSAEALAAAESPARRAHAAGWARALAAAEPGEAHHEPAAEALAAAFAGYLGRCREAGLAALAPGRFLLPGDLAGAPALTFAPLPLPAEVPQRESLYAEMARRFEAYKRVVVRPFFRNHFARLDRQVVLIDALGTLARGPRAMGDLMASLEATLAAFRHGRAPWLERLIGGRRIDRLLIAASKADHLHHSAHGALARLVEAMVADAAGRAAFKGAELRAVALAALRATVEQEMARGGKRYALVRGRRLDTGRDVAVHPGALPDDPAGLLAAAADPGRAAPDWPAAEFAQVHFAPPDWAARRADGPPHIRLDKALDFLIADRLE